MSEIYWRDSQRPVRFFIFDAKASFPIILFLFHARLWTLTFAFLVMVFFWILERKGLNFTTALRVARSFIIGNFRPRTSKLEKIRMKDFD
jgi:intracellular multiplication protein IcmT